MKYLVTDEHGMLGVFSDEGDARAFQSGCHGSTVDALPFDYPIVVLCQFAPERRERSFWSPSTVESALACIRDATTALPNDEIVANVYLLERDFRSPHPCGWIESRIRHEHLSAGRLRRSTDVFPPTRSQE